MLNFVGGAGEGLKLVSKRKVKTTPEGEALLAGAYCVSKKSCSALVSLGPFDISYSYTMQIGLLGHTILIKK